MAMIRNPTCGSQLPRSSGAARTDNEPGEERVLPLTFHVVPIPGIIFRVVCCMFVYVFPRTSACLNINKCLTTAVLKFVGRGLLTPV